MARLKIDGKNCVPCITIEISGAIFESVRLSSMYNGYAYFFSSDEELVQKKCFIMVVYYKMPAKFKREREKKLKRVFILKTCIGLRILRGRFFILF